MKVENVKNIKTDCETNKDTLNLKIEGKNLCLKSNFRMSKRIGKE